MATTYRPPTKRAGAPRLTVTNISTYYGEARALRGVSLRVHLKEVVTILGSNGAGKTTLLKTITGLLAPREGNILFEDSFIEGKPTYEIVRHGISTVPEGRELFGQMSVLDNLILGTYSLPPRNRKPYAPRLERVFSLFPILKVRIKQKAETMSGGQQQMLAVGRALMGSPKLLALDEPSLGLSPFLVVEMMKALKEISIRWGLSIVLVEQNARAALKIADYVYILERGELGLQGTCQEVADSPSIQKAYLGG